jgi:hypothetical protein
MRMLVEFGDVLMIWKRACFGGLFIFGVVDRKLIR